MNEKKLIDDEVSDGRMVLICKKPAKLSLHFYESFDLIYFKKRWWAFNVHKHGISVPTMILLGFIIIIIRE